MSGASEAAAQAGKQAEGGFSDGMYSSLMQGPGTLVLMLAGAVMGWRVEENGWASMLWLLTCMAVKLIREPFVEMSKQDTFSKGHNDAVDKVAIFALALGGGNIPLAHLMTGVLSFANYYLPGWVPALTFLLLLPGIALFRESHVCLGRNWNPSTKLREGHELVTTGVYEHVRHPMYTGLSLIFSTFPLLIHNWIAGFAPVLGFAIFYIVRVSNEEEMMQERFGDAYREYMKRSGRLWPPFSKKIVHTD